MAKKKELLSKAPWRGDDEDDSDKFSNAKLKVTKDSDGMSKMHVPSRGTKKGSLADDDDDSLEIDPQLRYSFNRNYQFLQSVFTIDTLVKPLPPSMAFNVSRNLSFFTRIFTQFFDPEGIANAQKSLGLGQEEKARRVR
ncbi:hypothetical protein AtNW77_Chr1g0037671 [Arabidopsis thaliana]|uniref:Uncharacterized protein n=4 Tax=Arabidopsis TaxID=3701 RepID=A0A178WN70_ARATH|nr:zinc finger/BTB domain protein [Arabidopsis thaliana]KAG7648380.1 hypothetical protein ISN45_At01g033440 [Arabidopsis thaliana x Arabidopsis arenosa]KAG7656305.1 hypothetical protein ISN44_As01g033030 [Arabidopsis suecica]AAM65886.1 unknown [Arabidopsis thaliana]AAO50558.1 unknown protein [Arabidopsis thaliana]AEE31627.1 zinc finger/BTB domain protein [Arabidopsis thaliana]|eukprot:NP_564429.1 zinc finger/BTB domain protein [Arabidopsis thaliana]